MINKYQLVTKKKWRMYVNDNKKKAKMLPNDDRLFVSELSIEATHQILMCKGPEADEFNIGGVQNFGNWITTIEFHLYNIYFFL
jgi:hypothetical protein